MPKLNQIYTRTGDQGTTHVVGGAEVSKASPLVEAYGTVDELNSHLGLIRATAANLPEIAKETEGTLSRIQNNLFDIGSLLATPPDYDGLAERLDEFHRPLEDGRDEHVAWLEAKIDEYRENLAPLPNFVLPGGCTINAQAHIARTVCRRLERVLVARHNVTPVDAVIMKYVNRLSDFLFVYARWTAWKLGQSEIIWEPNG